MPSYRIGQVAELLGVSVDTVRRWADAGRLGATRTAGGQRLVDSKVSSTGVIMGTWQPAGEIVPGSFG